MIRYPLLHLKSWGKKTNFTHVFTPSARPGSFPPFARFSFCASCLRLQILVLELNDEAAEQTVEAKVVDLLQGQEGFRWKVRTRTPPLFHACRIFQRTPLLFPVIATMKFLSAPPGEPSSPVSK